MNILFLDIDGVLQSPNSQKRFEVNRESLISYLTNIYNVDYSQYNEYDVAAVYFDWDKIAVNRVKKILEKTNAFIVITSNWKNKLLPNKMKDLLKIQGLDKYYVGETANYYDIKEIDKTKAYHYKVIEILDYLKQNKNITNYVVVDDLDLSNGLKGHFVRTNNIISAENAENCIRILKRK